MKIGGMHWTILSRNIRFPFPIHFPMPNWSTLLEFISSGKISCDLADPHFLMCNKVYFHVENITKMESGASLNLSRILEIKTEFTVILGAGYTQFDI